MKNIIFYTHIIVLNDRKKYINAMHKIIPKYPPIAIKCTKNEIVKHNNGIKIIKLITNLLI